MQERHPTSPQPLAECVRARVSHLIKAAGAPESHEGGRPAADLARAGGHGKGGEAEREAQHVQERKPHLCVQQTNNSEKMTMFARRLSTGAARPLTVSNARQ